MSSNVNKKYHLTKEARFILLRLRDSISETLDMDVEGCDYPFANSCSLYPFLYQAFIKIWCNKVQVICRRVGVVPCSLTDVPARSSSFSISKELINKVPSCVGIEPEDLPF